MELNRLHIQTNNICECGYEFNIRDITKLERIKDNSFYSGVVKHYSITKCPKCSKETILLLKQVGQTYKLMNIAIEDERSTTMGNINAQNNEKNTNSNELICPVCQKVCKNKLGYNAHMRTHQN